MQTFKINCKKESLILLVIVHINFFENSQQGSI